MKLLRRIALVAAVLLMATTTTFMCQRVAQRGRFARDYSSYGSGPGGMRALYLLAERLGAQPERWAQDLARLPADAMLVAAGGCEAAMARDLSRYESEELVRWVQGGGVLLVAGARHYLPEELGVRFESEANCSPDLELLQPERGGAGQDADEEPPAGEDAAPLHELLEESGEGPAAGATHESDMQWAAVEGGPLRGLESVSMRRPGRIAIDDGVDYQTLLSLPDAPTMPISNIRREAAVAVRHGAGRVIVLASGSMLQNESLAASEGAVMFARLVRAYAPGARILFDEYHLGLGERRSMTRYLRQMGAAPVVLQLIFVCLLWLWRGGARFGAIREVPPAPPRGTASFVAAMGSLFSRARDPAGALDIVVKQALRRIARHHHVPPATARALARTLRERGADDAAQAVEQIARAARSLTGERGGLSAAVRRVDAAVARATR